MLRYCSIVISAIMTAIALMTTAPSATDIRRGSEADVALLQLSPLPIKSGGKPLVPLYDTAWKLAVEATDAEIDDYLMHLSAAGFTGSWFRILPNAGIENRVRGTSAQAFIVQKGKIRLTSTYIHRLNNILNQSRALGLKHGLVVAWANEYLCPRSEAPQLTEASAFAFGKHVAQVLNVGSSVDYWVLGGDMGGNGHCPDSTTFSNIWSRMKSGIRAGGSHQPIAYHVSAHYRTVMAKEPWLDLLAVQTGHGSGAKLVRDRLEEAAAAIGSASKVIAGELSYYEFRGWTYGTVHVDADFIARDTSIALAVGVKAIVYGDWDRWYWCRSDSSAAGMGRRPPCDNRGIQGTFHTAGESAFLDVGYGRRQVGDMPSEAGQGPPIIPFWQ
jgi:hypothetical protein